MAEGENAAGGGGSERPTAGTTPVLEFRRLGRVGYKSAYELQQELVAEVLGWREQPPGSGAPDRAGIVLMLEHDPVVTVSNRPSAATNLVASPELLARAGVAVEPTDRGGDITYHGPGQLVVYPILDLNRVHLRLHEYMRRLEAAVIATCVGFGVSAARDVSATGVWVGGEANPDGEGTVGGRKICAMGVRVRQWVSLHGLALNVRTDLSHFGLIVPCGLVGRPVTSLAAELGDRCPPMEAVMDRLTDNLARELGCQAG